MASTNPITTSFETIQPSYNVEPVGFQQTFGSITPVLDISTVANDGGTKISATGVSLPDGDYELRVGPLGSILDPVCFGGVKNPSRPDVQLLDGAFECVVPPNPIGGPYSFTFTNLDTESTNTSDPVLTVVAHDFASRVLSLRRLFPPKWKTGTRKPEFEDLPQI